MGDASPSSYGVGRLLRTLVVYVAVSLTVWFSLPYQREKEWRSELAFACLELCILALPLPVIAAIEIVRRIERRLGLVAALARTIRRIDARLGLSHAVTQATRRVQITWQTIVSAFFDLHGPETTWIVAGIVSLALAVSSAFFNAPEFSERWTVPGLFVFGCFSCATSVFALEATLATRVAGPAPRDSLHPGQFVFAFAGLLGLSVLAVVLFGGTFAGAAILQGVLDPQWHPQLRSAIPWVAGIVCGLGALAAIASPFTTAFAWASSRRRLQQMRDDALFALAGEIRHP